MELSVLSISDDIVKLEDEDLKISYCRLSEMPEGIKVNDIIEYKNGGYKILAEKTKERKEQNIKLLNSLWED
ncbi:MAG: DUF3006 domain-containing protein [Ruminococcus sp.]|nr:DUF3006 domain-containing protein [Ruminococcus sp.]